MGCCNQKCGIFALFSVGSVLVVLGLLLSLFWGSLYNRVLSDQLVLANNSRSYELWKETPIPMYLSIYLFNWTNADEVLEKKWAVKPELQECGPYVFSEHHVRVNLVWNDNGTITYQQKRIWHFIPELSTGTLRDNITNLNPIVAVVANKIKDMNYVAKKLANLALKGLERSIITTRTVDELLFTGYEDKILNIISKLKIKGLNVPFSKFGWFYSRNESESYDGNFTMYTGKTGIDLVGVMDLWNGRPYTDDYNGYCALVNGTSGELWPPVKNYQQVSIFSPDICSSIPIEYKDTEVVHGVTGKRFIGTDFAFDNGTKYPGQACFHGEKVVPSGTRDISKCRFGAPAFVSYPHFYLADPSYVEAVKGMHPNKTDHEMSMSLEPSTGLPLHAQAQLQISLFIDSIPSMSMFENIKPTYIPMLWFRQTALLTEEYASMVRVMIVLSSVGEYIGWSLVGVGVLCAIIGTIVLCRKDWKDRELEHLLEEEEPEQ